MTTVAAKERPILFSGPMVQAILDGRKTQTRRVIKPQPTTHDDGMIGHRDLAGHFAAHVFGPCMTKLTRCPYGQPGDRLWVKTGYFRDAYNAPSGRRFVAGMFMPRHMSPVTLEITGVRVERLQSITEDDAIAEGVETLEENGWLPTLNFQLLWDSINAKRGYGWDSNPWVWVIEFRRVAA